MERGSRNQLFFAGSGRTGGSGAALLVLLWAAEAAGTPAEPGADKRAPALVNYTVLPGDSCGHIARRLYGDSHRIDLIHKNNDLGPLPHKLRPGMVLRLPVSATAGSGEPDARLTFVRNQVEAYTPDYHRGQKNEALAEGNRVGTLAASSAEISFVDETRMQLGEHSMVVIFGEDGAGSGSHRRAAGSQEATLLRGTLRAHLDELAGPGPAPRKPITVTTPAARVELPVRGSEVHVDVDPERTTRLSVLRGRSQLAAAGRRVQVPAGFGSRANQGRPPTPPRPLPGAPQWSEATPLPALLLSRRGPAAVLSYRPGSGPPAALWHRQLARDASFNDLLQDSRVPAAELTWSLGELPAGELFLRVSAIDADRFEGPATPVQKTRVAVVQLLPGGTGAPAAVQLPPDLYCGLDGEPLHRRGRVSLTAARQHVVRCALTQDAAPAAAGELLIPAADSGAVLAQPEHGETQWSATHGERDFSFRLVDGAGTPLPLPVQDLQLRAAAGVSAAPLVAGAPGEYRTHLRWPLAVADLGLAVQLRGVQLAAIPLVPDPRESEPPPTHPPQLLAPPRLQPIAPPEPRLWLDLGAAGVALFNQGSYGLGGVLEVGPRIRLPFGSLGLSLRLSFEQHLQPAPPPEILNVGGALTYFIARSNWRLSPYVGLWAQGLFARVPAAPGDGPPPSSRSLSLGGLVGVQVRLYRGGLFTELGYRGAVYQPTPGDLPAGNTFSLLLGYRLSIN